MTETPQPPQTPPPPQQPAAPPPGAARPAGQPSNGMAVAALVLGILAILFGLFIQPIGIILGVLAIVFGIIGRNRAKENPALGRGGMALAGLITGVIGLLISIVILVLAVVLVSEVVNNPEQFGITTEIR